MDNLEKRSADLLGLRLQKGEGFRAGCMCVCGSSIFLWGDSCSTMSSTWITTLAENPKTMFPSCSSIPRWEQACIDEHKQRNITVKHLWLHQPWWIEPTWWLTWSCWDGAAHMSGSGERNKNQSTSTVLRRASADIFCQSENSLSATVFSDDGCWDQPLFLLTPDVSLWLSHVGHPTGVVLSLGGSEGHVLGQVILPVLLKGQISLEASTQAVSVFQQLYRYLWRVEATRVTQQHVGFPQLSRRLGVHLNLREC